MLSKAQAVLAYLRARIVERSTWMFMFGSLASVASLPRPFNWIGFVILMVAAFVPDGPVK
jgi:hypothetical protein